MASGNINPVVDYNPPTFTLRSSWDTVKIGGMLCPGICEITGFERGWGWDIKQGKGAQGTDFTYTSKIECEGEITFYLWTGQHFQQWETFRPQFKYDPTKNTKPQPISIFHPSLHDIDVTKVVTRKISPIKHLGDLYFSCTVKFLCWEPPPAGVSAVATPTKPKPDATNPNQPPPPGPFDDLQAQLGALAPLAGFLGFSFK
jgi:hypothetical protein